MRRFVEQLRRRNVLRAATFYAAGAWLLIQIATQVFPFFDIPNWAVRLVVVAVIVGFPFALVISWFYELTPSGFRREIEPDADQDAGLRRKPALRFALLSASGIAATALIAATLVGRQGASEAPASVAVMPFRNLSGDAETAYFAEGIQDEIITRLTHIASLRVISRTSTAAYSGTEKPLPRIANELGVEHVLEGGVQRQADAVRVNARLIKASKDLSLWAETYDRKLTDVFDVESEVAQAVVESLRLRLSGAERHAVESAPTANPEAYDQYLRGIALTVRPFEPSNLERAAAYLRRAVNLDPEFALAWARLARIDVRLASQGIDLERCGQGGHEAARALQLQPALGEAHLAEGYHLLVCNSDLAAARSVFQRAQAELPGSAEPLEALAGVERGDGAWDEAVEYMRRALVLDPRNAKLLGEHALTLAQTRRFDQARAAADRGLQELPGDGYMLALKALSYQAEGRLEEAARLLATLPDRAQGAEVLDYQVLQDLYQRRYRDAIERLQRALAQDLAPVGVSAGDYWYLLGVAQRAVGDSAGARRSFSSGRAYLARFLGDTAPPDTDLYLRAMLCLMDAGAGAVADRDGACRSTATAAGAGGPYAPSASEALARAAALRGDVAGALALLPQLLQASYYSFLYSAPLTPALLRQDPVWDGLRGDPRFRALSGS
jgi:TolB-like protein/Flp pilus assembly protein TadD